MYSKNPFKQYFYLFGFFAAIAVHAWAISLEEPDRGSEGEATGTTDASSSSVDSAKSVEITEESSESSGTFQEYTIGNHSYFATKPISVEDYLARVYKWSHSQTYWLFEDDWMIRKKQETLRNLSLADEEYATLKKDIAETFQEQKRRTNCEYESLRIRIIDLVEPCHIPRNLAWRFGLLLALYGNFDNERTLWDLEPSLGSGFEREQSDNAKLLEFYKASLLFFSYYLGLSDRLPPVLQYANLHEIVSHSEFISALDVHFQKEFFLVDETVWIRAIQELEHQHLEHICVLFRCFYRLFLQNRDSLPEFYVSLAAHLSNITTKVMLSVQKKPDLNLDAINPWMFKLYIDLKRWEALRKEDKTLPAPEFHTLLPILQEQCLRLLPSAFTLEDIAEGNEYAICEGVRMRNLLPINQWRVDRDQEIWDEFQSCPQVRRRELGYFLNFFSHRTHFVMGYELDVEGNGSMIEQIHNYLSGYVEMSDIPVIEDNALDYLRFIKIFDHAGYIGFNRFYYPRTTYELRKQILKLAPHLKTYEVLTVSLNSQKVRDERDEITPGAWVDESESLRQICIDDLLKRAQHLSDMMEQSPLKGIVVGTRGISGAGKSTFLKGNILPFILPEDQREPQQINALAQGILNPDTIKAALKNLQGGIFNTQIHEEGSNAFNQLFREIADKASYILDKRQLTPYEIATNLVQPAKNGGRSVWLFDFDISLTTSITRILARPLYGEDPCPAYEALIDGFLSARRYRAQAVQLALKENTIARYELYATSRHRLIAHKASGEDCPFGSGSPNSLCIHDLYLFEESLREPTYQEIESELSQVINETFISEAIARGNIAAEQRQSIEKWRGMSLKTAIQLHVQGGKGVDDECLFEPAVVLPFNGEEWLGDMPQLISYLQSEHQLHTHGIDESGEGLHWEMGKIEKGLNPKYHPEAKVPGYTQAGIQMRVGYFILPRENFELCSPKHRSIPRELYAHDENGKRIGYRFFVHPEAYAHFAPLLRANIPFVPPSKSEFMGTPTSSYNSWLLRRVSTTDTEPFIVKMGTPNGCSDTKHLLSGDDICKSLSCQERLDELPVTPEFVLFKETAGIILTNIPGYPPATVDSGIVFCELPEQLLTGECKILSFSAIMSCERVKPENRGVAALNAYHEEVDQLPLIYELIDVAIQKGLVKSPEEFLQFYFIDAYLNAIETLVFKEGFSLGGNGQNLSLVLNPDHTIKGFAYRDFEGLTWRNNFMESYSWFYRYTNFTKLLNVITQYESDEVPPPLGAPIRSGTEKPSSERNLYRYLYESLNKEGAYTSLDALKRLSITPEESTRLLKQLDASYLALLKRYFAIDEADILNPDGTVPCAEKGSLAEKDLRQKNRALWEKRISADQTQYNLGGKQSD